MEPTCDRGGFGETLTRVGRWFRTRAKRTFTGATVGYGSPATMFVVRAVKPDKLGCFIGLVHYGYITPRAISQLESDPDGVVRVAGTTLVHELGHSCDLLHTDGTVMHPTKEGCVLRFTRWQRAWLRSSRRVTFR